jgi:tape measure domain-containing protein
MAKQSTLTYVLQARIDKLEAGLNQANKKMSSFQRSTKNISSQIQGHFVAMFGVAAVIAFGKATFDLILKLDGVNRALKAVSESSADYQRAKLLLSITSEKYGANILDLTSAYTKFSAATKGSTLSTKELDGVFTSITKSAGVLGLSAEQTEGTFKALEQMFSKGTVAAEEIRGQLSERLPGAFTILAKSMGITTEELNKQLKLGNVLADEVLPKFALEYEKAIGADQVKRVETLTSEVQRLGNAWTLAVESMAKSGGVFAKVLKDLNDEITIARGLFEGKLKGKELFLDFADLADLVRKKDEEALVAATKLAAGQKAALTTIFDAYVLAGRGAQDFLDTQKLMRKYNLSDALDPAQITEVLGMFDSFTKSMDEGLQSLKDAAVVLPDTLNSLNAEMDDLKSQRLGALASQIAGIDRQIDALDKKIKNFGSKGGSLGSAPSVSGMGMSSSMNDSLINGGSDKIKPLLQSSPIVEAYKKLQEDLKIQQATILENQNAFINEFSTSLISGFTQGLVGGGIEQAFNNILSIIGDGLVRLGESLVSYGLGMEALKKALKNPLAGGSGLAVVAGVALIAAGSALSAAVARSNSKTSSGLGGGGGGGSNRGFNGGLTGQSMKVGGEFTIRGRDLVYILDQNKTKDGRAKANF